MLAEKILQIFHKNNQIQYKSAQPGEEMSIIIKDDWVFKCSLGNTRKFLQTTSPIEGQNLKTIT